MALVPSLAPILGDPFLTDVERSLNRALQPFFSGGTSAVGFPGALATMPMPGALFDVKETDHSYQLIADTPGMTPDDIHVELSHDNSTLTISGEKKHEVKHEKRDKQGQVRYHRQERTFTKFNRSFALPEDARPDAIHAHIDNGVLTIDIEKRPKEQERKARRIAVQATPGAASQHLGVEGGSVGKTGAAATGGTAGEGTQPEKASVPVTGGTQ